MRITVTFYDYSWKVIAIFPIYGEVQSAYEAAQGWASMKRCAKVEIENHEVDWRIEALFRDNKASYLFQNAHTGEVYTWER